MPPTPQTLTPPLRVAVAGLGAIGLPVVTRIAGPGHGIPGISLASVSARDLVSARARLDALGIPPNVACLPLEQLAEDADVVIECVPAAHFTQVARPCLERGKVLVPLSVGKLLEHPELVDLARSTGGRIVVPTGALLALDAVRAAAQGQIFSVKMVTRKPPNGLEGAPYLIANGISLNGLTEAKKVFEGTAREGAKGFPANVNIAAALSLAGIGPDRTMLEIWADPHVTRNIHRVTVDSDAARFEMSIESVPSEENPRTGKLTPLSVIACLRGMVDTLKVGT